MRYRDDLKPRKAATLRWHALIIGSAIALASPAFAQYVACADDADALLAHCGASEWCGKHLAVCLDFNFNAWCHWEGQDDLTQEGTDPCLPGGLGEDTDPCTNDYCDKAADKCRHDPIPGCVEPPTRTPTPTVDPRTPTPIKTTPVPCSAITSEEFLISCCNSAFQMDLRADPCVEAHPVNDSTCGLYGKDGCVECFMLAPSCPTGTSCVSVPGVVGPIIPVGVCATPTPRPICPGDCDGNGLVAINELVMAVDMALGEADIGGCSNIDTDHSGTVTISEIVAAVESALNGCPGAPTPTLGPTAVVPTTTSTPDNRFVDNQNGTITDRTTGLVWEKKDGSGGLHAETTRYVWAGLCSGHGLFCQPDAAAATACNAATHNAYGCDQCTGTATCDTSGHDTIWSWLNQLNAMNFAGFSDWRIPTIGIEGDRPEFESIADENVPGCPSVGSGPCIAGIFNAGCTAGCTLTGCSCSEIDYWTASAYSPDISRAWVNPFINEPVADDDEKYNFHYARAVRGGR